MPSRIVLVRHGRSAHVHRDGWIDAAGLRAWRAAYELAAIDPADRPPARLVADVHGATLVVASDAPRAIASAERLVGSSRAVAVSPLLRETDLRVPGWVRGRLPLMGWALAIGVEWLRARGDGGRTPEPSRARADAAAAWLIDRTPADGLTVAITHADFRRLLSAGLTRTGWRLVERHGAVGNWSAWTFVAPVRGTSGRDPSMHDIA